MEVSELIRLYDICKEKTDCHVCQLNRECNDALDILYSKYGIFDIPDNLPMYVDRILKFKEKDEI